MLTASAGTGYTFTGWSGACTNTTGKCSVTMTTAKNVTATFTPNTYTVTATAGTGGTIFPSSKSVNYGSTATFTVTSNEGYSIGSVSGCNGTLNGSTYTTGAITSSCTVSATFTLNKYSLTVTKAGTGAGTVISNPSGINCGTNCTLSFNYNTSVVLTPTPSTGSVFSGWSGDSDCYDGSVVMTSNKSCTATFTLNKYLLTVTKSGTGTVSSDPTGISCGSDCTESYNYDTSVLLTASAGTGYTFTGWSGACTNTTGKCSVTMTTAKNVTATFTPVMSGTLVPASSYCVIETGLSSCTVNSSWSVTNPEGATSAITASGMSDINLTGTSGTKLLTVPYSSRTFYLYNNAKSLVPTSESPTGSGVTVSAFCNTKTGDVWNPTLGKCETPVVETMSGTLVPESSSCVIATGSSSCTVKLDWEILNPTGTPTAITASGMTDQNVTTTLVSPQSGIASVVVPYNSRTFYLYNNSVSLVTPPVAVSAVCDTATGDVWNPTLGKCETPVVETMSGTLVPESSSCVIATGSSSCTVKLDWEILNPTGTPTAITASGMTDQNVTTTLVSPQSGIASVVVPYNSRTFYLYNNSVSLVTPPVAVSAVCDTATGDVWNPTLGICENAVVVPFEDGKCSTTPYYCLSSALSTDQHENPTSYAWTCPGTGGGSDASCVENKIPVDGVCSNPQIAYSCISGTSIPLTETVDSFKWNCEGLNGGTTDSCSQLKIDNPGWKEN